MKQILLSLVRAYQALLGSLLGGRCRFVPSCSEYAVLAIREHGAARGVALSVRRLCRCHPLSRRHGVDFPPPPAAAGPSFHSTRS